MYALPDKTPAETALGHPPPKKAAFPAPIPSLWPGLILLLLSGALLLFTARALGRRMALPERMGENLPREEALAGEIKEPSSVDLPSGEGLSSFAPPSDPAAPPLMVYFPSRGIQMEILPVGMDAAGRMGTPDTHNQAAWYREGPSPGEAGNALISGHRVWKGQRGYFSILPQMERGEAVVFLHQDGSLRVFYVDEVSIYPVNAVPARVMDPRLGRCVTLITCAGSFNRALGTSESRCVAVCRAEEEIMNFDPKWRYLPHQSPFLSIQ